MTVIQELSDDFLELLSVAGCLNLLSFCSASGLLEGRTVCVSSFGRVFVRRLAVEKPDAPCKIMYVMIFTFRSQFSQGKIEAE